MIEDQFDIEHFLLDWSLSGLGQFLFLRSLRDVLEDEEDDDDEDYDLDYEEDYPDDEYNEETKM